MRFLQSACLILFLANCLPLNASAPELSSSPSATLPVNDSQRLKERLALFTNGLFVAAPDLLDLLTEQAATETTNVNKLIDHLAKRVSDRETTPTTELSAWQLASARDVLEYHTKWGMVATTNSLRHFYNINSSRYPPKPFISGYELLVPATQIPDDQLSSTLSDIAIRLRTGEFSREAYLFSMSFGKPNTGYFSKGSPEELPSALRSAFLTHPLNKVFGPIETADGFVFGMATERLTSTSDLFDFYKEKVDLDFRREWTRKLLNDYLTTESARRKVSLFDYSTTAPHALEQIAYSVDNTTVTWQQIRNRYPNVIGNITSQAYWHALRRRAVESHILYLSDRYSEIEQTSEYQQLKMAIAVAAKTQKSIDAQVQGLAPTDQELRDFINTTPDAYQDPDIVSIRLYTCQDGQSTSPSTINNNPPDGDCRLRLAAIPVTKGQLPPGIQQRNISDTPVSALPREIQVALGNNPAGFISQPFFMDGALYVAELTNRVRGRLPDLEEVRQDALFNYRQHQRQAILRTLLDLPQR